MNSLIPTFEAHTPEPPDDAALAASFEAFFERHLPEIVGYLWRMTTDEQAAYDLSQEVFLRAWRHFAEISVYEHPRAWLFRVATNLALNHLRKQARWRGSAPPPDATLATRPAGTTFPVESLDDPVNMLATTDPTAAVAERDAIRSALMELEPWYRATLTLHAVFGLTIAEIAETLGVSVSATKTRLARSRKRFRARYLRDLQDPASQRAENLSPQATSNRQGKE